MSFVFSADGHIVEPRDLYTANLPPDLAKFGIRVMAIAPGAEAFMVRSLRCGRCARHWPRTASPDRRG